MLSMLSHWHSIIQIISPVRPDQVWQQQRANCHLDSPVMGFLGLCRCRGVGLLQCFGLSLHPRDSVAPDSQFRINLRQNEKNITSLIIPAVDAGFSRGSVV